MSARAMALAGRRRRRRMGPQLRIHPGLNNQAHIDNVTPL